MVKVSLSNITRGIFTNVLDYQIPVLQGNDMWYIKDLKLEKSVHTLYWGNITMCINQIVAGQLPVLLSVLWSSEWDVCDFLSFLFNDLPNSSWNLSVCFSSIISLLSLCTGFLGCSNEKLIMWTEFNLISAKM